MAFRLVVLASGSGTNLQAILDQLHGHKAGEGGPAIEVAAVASDKRNAGALVRAREAGIDTGVFTGEEYPDRAQRDAAMADWIAGLGCDLVVLAGYMQLLSPEFVARFAGRVVNIHPALLPSFPGLDAIGQALEHGVQVTGVSVHFVDEGVDSGPIITQQPVPVPPDRDRGALEEAVHRIEHSIYPQTIRMIAQGRVRIDPHQPRVVIIDD
jgi:phosphoribosylglycinamide formyltransferase-1